MMGRIYRLDVRRLFEKVPRGERLGAAQDLLVLMRNMLPYATYLNQDRARDALQKMIGVIRLFSVDDAVTMEEAGGPPDDISKVASSKYEAINVVDEGLSVGVTVRETLDRATRLAGGVEPETFVDDPEIKEQSIQAFGQGTSPHDSEEVKPDPADGADVPSTSTQTIGFGPPPPSED